MNKRLRDKRKKVNVGRYTSGLYFGMWAKYKQQLIIYQLAELKRRYEVLS